MIGTPGPHHNPSLPILKEQAAVQKKRVGGPSLSLLFTPIIWVDRQVMGVFDRIETRLISDGEQAASHLISLAERLSIYLKKNRTGRKESDSSTELHTLCDGYSADEEEDSFRFFE